MSLTISEAQKSWEFPGEFRRSPRNPTVKGVSVFWAFHL